MEEKGTMEAINAIPQENPSPSPQQPESPTTMSNSQESCPVPPQPSSSSSSTTMINVQEDLAPASTSSQVPEPISNSSSSQMPLENAVSHSPQELSSSSIPNVPSSAAVASPPSSDHHQTAAIQTVSPERVQEEQLKYCGTMLKSIKKLRDASPFLQPVDPIALGIPDYTIIIKTPMDLSTIEQKLLSSQYPNAEAFLDDIKLMLSNCFTYNPPETVVHKMGRSVERQVENLVKKMPTEESISKALASSTSLSSGNAAAAAGGEKKRKSSTLPGAASQAKKRSTSSVGDSYSPSAASANALDGASSGGGAGASTPKIASGRRAASKKASSSAGVSGLKGEDLKNSLAIWREVTKKSTLVWPFMQPVDPIALGIPDYFTVIREPMDFGTVKKRIDAGEYGNFGEFEREMRLVFTNCYTYNAPDSDVVSLAKQVEAIFEAKLAAVISKSRTFSAASSTPSSMAGAGISSSAVAGGVGGYDSAVGGVGGAAAEDSGDDSDSEKMHSLKQQLASIKAQIAAIVHKRKMRKGTSSTAAVSGVSSGTATGKAKSASSAFLPKERKKSAGKTELTFEEKRQLSYDINFLPPEKLTDVVEIIRESIPSLKSSEEEIELDIDSLDVKTQRKLQAFVMKHQQQTAASKGGQPSSVPGTTVPVNKAKERFSDTSDDSDSD